MVPDSVRISRRSARRGGLLATLGVAGCLDGPTADGRSSRTDWSTLAAADGSQQLTYEAPAGILSSPLAGDGVFVVVGWNAGSHGQAQRTVRVDEGSETWRTDPRDRFLNVLDAGSGAIYLGTSDDEYGLQGETLFALEASSGDQRWWVEAGDTTGATLQGNTLYTVAGGRQTTAFEVSDGSERWSRDMPPATYEPRVFGDAMYLESERKNEHGNYL